MEDVTGSAVGTDDPTISALIYNKANQTIYFISRDGHYEVYFTEAGVVETVKFNGGDSSLIKKLNSVSVQTDYLGSEGQVTLKYRKDNKTTWTTIFTNTGENSISHEACNIESTSENLPQFKDIQFRIEVLGRTTILGLRFRYEELIQNL
jgi:hypothetical protein